MLPGFPGASEEMLVVSQARWRLTLCSGLVSALLLLPSCAPTTAERLAEAKALIEQGKREEGLQLLREAAGKDPGAADVQYEIGLLLVKMGRTTEALFPLREASNSEEFEVIAGLLLASKLSESGNHEEALTTLDRVLARDPENRSALWIRASAAMALHRGELALESADRLLAIEPDQAAFRHLRAVALLETGKKDEARQIFETLLAEQSEDPTGPARACGALTELLIREKETQAATAQLAECGARFLDAESAVLGFALLYDELERSEDAVGLLRRALEAKPESASLRAALGKRLVSANRFGEAESLLKEALAEKESAEGWLALAGVRKAMADAEGALEAVTRAEALENPPAPLTRFNHVDLLITLGRLDEAEALVPELGEPLYERATRARLAQARGHPEQALELYEDVLINWPQNHGIRVLSAIAALDVNDLGRAESDLLEATRQAPKETDAALWLARIYFAQGKYAEAAAFASRQIQERGATAPDAHLLAARAYARVGQRQAANAVLNDLATVRDGRFAAEAVAETARLVAASGKPTEARRLLEQQAKTRKLDLEAPEGEPLLTQLFQLMVDSGEVDAAAARARKLVAAHPDRPALHALQGRIDLVRGDRQAAEAAFAKALELDPDHPAALAGDALLLRDAGKQSAAADLMERAWSRQHHPDYGYMAARMRLDAGEAERARELFQDVLRENPDNAAAANDLAFLLAERGESLDRAKQLADSALRLAPSPEVLDTVGYVLLKQGHIHEATEAFRRVVESKPDYATARYHLALALFQDGDRVAARESLEKALETSFPEAGQARELLANIDGSGGSIQ